MKTDVTATMIILSCWWQGKCNNLLMGAGRVWEVLKCRHGAEACWCWCSVFWSWALWFIDNFYPAIRHFCLLDLQWQSVQRCTDWAGGSRGECEEDMSWQGAGWWLSSSHARTSPHMPCKQCQHKKRVVCSPAGGGWCSQYDWTVLAHNRWRGCCRLQAAQWPGYGRSAAVNISQISANDC